MREYETELYRYITWDDGQAGEELFDEINDPGELRNLADALSSAGQLPEAVAEFRRAMGAGHRPRSFLMAERWLAGLDKEGEGDGDDLHKALHDLIAKLPG